MLLLNAAIIILSLPSLRGATRKFAVLVNRYSKAFTVISMDSTRRDLYNSLLFRTSDVRKNTCKSLAYSWTAEDPTSSTWRLAKILESAFYVEQSGFTGLNCIVGHGISRIFPKDCLSHLCCTNMEDGCLSGSIRALFWRMLAA